MIHTFKKNIVIFNIALPKISWKMKFIQYNLPKNLLHTKNLLQSPSHLLILETSEENLLNYKDDNLKIIYKSQDCPD